MKKTSILAAVAPMLAGAVDLNGLASDDFAEKFAFSTNRSELVASLNPNSREYFVYSILHAQTEGRLDDAERLLKDWEAKRDGDAAISDLRARQFFLSWDDASPNISELRRILGNYGIHASLPPKETALAPDTYPSSLDQSAVSFAAFHKRANPLNRPRAFTSEFESEYAFLPFAAGGALGNEAVRNEYLASILQGNASLAANMANIPCFFDALVSWARSQKESTNLLGTRLFEAMSLDRLLRLGDALKGTPNDLRGNSQFVKCVLGKITIGADEDAADPIAALAASKRRVEFAKELLPNTANLKISVFEEYLRLSLSLGLESGALSEFGIFLAEVKEPNRNNYKHDDLIEKFILRYRFAGIDVSGFGKFIEAKKFAKILAEADLLSGKSAGEANASILSSEEYDALRNRVELNWSADNKRMFLPDDEVSLRIEVKNVPKMQIAIYELDALAAMKLLDGKVESDIDLDYAVPTVRRAVSFGNPSIVRHEETLTLPELKSAGLYVVECSGAGVSSRAFIRKGALRAAARQGPFGYSFCVYDDAGEVVKGAKAWIDGTSFDADENGLVTVPFAPSDRQAGRKKAILSAGSLATVCEFDHKTETARLALNVVLPVESLVAGCEATALIFPQLEITNESAPIDLLENPVLVVTFTDISGRTSVQTFRNIEFPEGGNTAVKFTVPSGVVAVDFSLMGKIKSATTGKTSDISAKDDSFRVNSILGTKNLAQAFMRHSSEGWTLELRGRNGEPLAQRDILLNFKHKVFKQVIDVRMQSDAKGAIHLGKLANISRVTCVFNGRDWAWNLSDKSPSIPAAIAVAEGETVEIPVKNLLDGEWFGAGDLENRVSLVAKSADGKTLDCRSGLCEYSDGVLRILALAPGDYELTMREFGARCRISVAKRRILASAESPARLRIASAELSGDGSLTVRTANANEAARIHIFAARTRGDETDGLSPDRAIGNSIKTEPVIFAQRSARISDFVSGRKLGEKLQYVLDRRDQSGRLGNTLSMPSLLLNPWSVKATSTIDRKMKDGEDWEASSANRYLATEEEDSASTRGGFGYGKAAIRSGYACRDFLPQGEIIVANVAPDADGVAVIDIGKFGGISAQDILVVAADMHAVDSVSVLGALSEIAPRDLRSTNDRKPASREKSYRTVDELFALMNSIRPNVLAGFDFLSEWSGKSKAEKIEIYGRHACHETDFFLYMKDRAFFDEVVAPTLRNKRFKTFVDRWLLGEDVSEWTAAARIDELNAFEQCLLAMRERDFAKVLAKRMADACEKDETNPEARLAFDRALDIALGTMNYVAAEMDCMKAPAAAALEPLESSPLKMRSMAASRNPGAIGAARRAKNSAPRPKRQFYKPVDTTLEWVETHYLGKRQNEDSSRFVKVNAFWRDFAKAIAEGKEGRFLSQNIIIAGDNATGALAAIAATVLPWTADESGAALVFARKRGAAAGTAESAAVVTQRIVDPNGEREDGSQGVEIKDGFEKGHVYELVTAVTNPTDENRLLSLSVSIPEGAIAIGGSKALETVTIFVEPYSIERGMMSFYFPAASDGEFRLAGAEAVETSGAVAKSPDVMIKVLERSDKTDRTSWAFVSQNGTKRDVLDYLSTKNLAGFSSADFAKIGWRMADGNFARKVCKVLSERGYYSEDLYLAGLVWKDAFDTARLRECLLRRENHRRLGSHLGPAIDSPIVRIDPERSGVFEHKEYWPMVNRYAHKIGGKPTILNESLRKEYREFLNVLAAKKSPTASDRLLAAVFLFAQDRIEDAAAQLALADEKSLGGEMLMQRDYIKVYMAFSHGDAAKGREIARRYAECPIAIWKERFAVAVAQADEALDGSVKEESAGALPSLSIAASASPNEVIVNSRNLDVCTLKVYPSDVEIAFTKNPFGDKSQNLVSTLKPAWEKVVSLDADGETTVDIPDGWKSHRLLVVAEGADARASASVEILPCAFDVQMVREQRLVRVRAKDGRPLAGAYVKVYSMDQNGEVEFHKDGYTDLRGVFDYESVSQSVPSRGRLKYSILVSDRTLGSKTLVE